MPQPLIAVTGSTGFVGGLVAERLSDQGANLRLIARDARKVPPIAGADVAVASEYLATEEMTAALRGADTLFMVSAHESANRLEQHYSAIDAAVAAGIERIVYTSLAGAAPDATFTLAREHFATEQAIRESGIAFAFQRQNLYLDFIPSIAGPSGKIRGPAGDGKIAPVARSDVADVAVTLLTDSSRDGKTFNISGRERYSLAECAARMTSLTDRSFEFVDETVEEAYESRKQFGAPAWQIEAWVTSYTAIAAGEFDLVTDSVKELTGHEPLILDELLAQNPTLYEHVKATAA